MTNDALGGLREVRDILAHGGDPELPEPLREISALRSAARRLLEADELTTGQRAEGFRRLLAAARAASLAPWAFHALEVELAEHFEDPPPEPIGEERAARHLARLGFAACPVCCLPLLSEAELNRRERARRAWAATEAVRAARREREAATP